jgi:hypothetical protein
MILNIRTRDNLHDLLGSGQTGEWVISTEKLYLLSKVRIYSWDGKQVLIGDFEPTLTHRLPNRRTLIGFTHGVIVSSYLDWFKFFRQSPIVYSQKVDLQTHGAYRVGVIRDLNIIPGEISEIDFFKNLIKEIKLLGLNKVVFCGGGTIAIPDSFKEWCKINGVDIEVFELIDLNRLYNQDNNIPIDVFISTTWTD